MRRHFRGTHLWAGVAAMVSLLVVITAVLSNARPLSATPARSVSERDAMKSGAPWFLLPPELNGRVLHWAQTNYFNEPGNADPANGQVITTEIWEVVGTVGTPIALHARSVYADGILHQENFFSTGNGGLIILGPRYKSLQQVSTPSPIPDWCFMGIAPRSKIPTIPAFVSESVLARYASKGGAAVLAHQPPSVASLSGARAIARYAPSQRPQLWLLADPMTTTSGRNEQRFEIGPGGHLSELYQRTIDPQGHLLREAWQATGAVDVYDAASVPASAYSVPQQQMGGCA